MVLHFCPYYMGLVYLASRLLLTSLGVFLILRERGPHSISDSISSSLCASDRRLRSWPITLPLLCLPLIGPPANKLHTWLQLLSHLVRWTLPSALLGLLSPWLNSEQGLNVSEHSLGERGQLWPRNEVQGRGGVSGDVLRTPLWDYP